MPADAYLGDYPAIGGNRVRLLVDGAAAFPAMLEAIARAQDSIALESYIYAADATGMRFLEALCARARAGVPVRVMVDGVGSFDTPESFWQPLVSAGGQVAVYHPVERWPWTWRLNHWRRNHRKLLIVDGATAFIGGLNIADEYAPVEWGGGAWHDAHAQVDGPAASGLGSVFDRTWRRQTGQQQASLASVPAAGPVAVQILESRLARRHSVRQAYLHAIGAARRTVRITNAYCIPDRRVRLALRAARRRGVSVQLLLAGRTDIKAVQYAGRYLYRAMMQWGVEIYEWTERVLHAKSAVIDGTWCNLGSYNLDRRSLMHNLEANIACVDASLGAALDAEFTRDMARARRIDPATWHRRAPVQKLLEVCFYQLRYLL